MENEHTYQVVAWWSSGRTGLAKCDSAPNAIHFTAPPEFGGVQGRWTPEALLLCAIASCYTTTFRAVEAQGAIRKADSGYEFGEIMIRPKLTISSEEEQPRALRLLEKTKNLCLVSRALSVTQIFEPRVHVTARAELGQAVFVG